ncbi:hypothetical protein OTU49_000869 [Cherax quadricarinatus]|uniref:Kinetochore protein SPC25 n=1 Tax=Cherax quadricarinatus TaxID=27406 RepID=A0AAW0XX91_CHEQU
MAVPATETIDLDAEFESYQQKWSMDLKSFKKIWSNSSNEIKSVYQQRETLFKKSKDDIDELNQKIKGIRQEISSIHKDKDRAGREMQRLVQELENISISLSEKTKEMEEHKEKLQELEKRVNQKMTLVENTEKNNQDCVSNIERGVMMFSTHLGLNVKCTNRNTLLFIFTQINRAQPNEEYMLELTLDEEKYHLLRSVPEISNLQELEDRLNSTNNFSGCIVHIRKLFQKMHHC